MRILVVGGGGREHALCWSLAKNSSIDRIYSAPGNAGIAELATAVAISPGDIPGIVEFAERESIDLTVVGPEAPLVAGLADEMQARGMAVFGPTRDGAMIEGSKAFARRLCEAHGIPGPRSGQFTELNEAMEFVGSLEAPYVVKADGLAAGKGVTIADDREAAEQALRECLVDGVFGDSGSTVVVEEFLEGEEVSALGLSDGRTVMPLVLAQDYKRVGDDDTGPNTGGMGAYSPLGFIDAELERSLVQALRSAVEAMENEGIRYRGVLYAGLMVTEAGPKLLEFNCRFGDPEAQVILPRLESNLAELLLACVEGNLSHYRLAWSPMSCVGVVLASGGYPGSYEQGEPIEGLGAACDLDHVQVFHSGTAIRDGKVVTAGGRVLTVCALGDDLTAAREQAYEACSLISFEGMTYRRDVAAGLRQKQR